MKRQLQKLFYPKSLAVVGASRRQGSVGFAIINNILDSSYSGEVYPINPKYRTIDEVRCFKKVGDVPGNIDLAIIATPAATVPDLILECGKKKIESVVIISAGFKEVGRKGKLMYDQILKNARKNGIRIVGPNCLGFLNTSIDLNASFASRMALKGNVAFLSQSGALCTSILDWSVTQNVGFSHLVSIGSTIDIDFHDLIDFFGADPHTACILIYMESLNNARAFMSAARAYARSKPIIVLKAGRSSEGARAALSHTGSLAGNDLVFDAAFRRAGIIRVDTIAQLFHLAQALAMQTLPKGNRLAIVTNAGGPGILATDYLMEHGGQLPKLSEEVVSHLNKVLSHSWSKKNPIDILGDATAKQYGLAVASCLADNAIDGVLVILTPQDVTDARDVAEQVSAVCKGARKPVLACWMGEEDVQAGREVLEVNRIPNFRFPERAVDVFLKIYSYFKNIELLYEFTPAIPQAFYPEREKAATMINDVLKKGRYRLNEREGKLLLSLYGIPVNLGEIVSSEKEAVIAAKKMGFPVVMKIASPDIGHKTDIGGVRLNVQTEVAVKVAFNEIMASARKHYPDANLEGILIERMINKPTELLIGANKDPFFGPVILFGMGGIAVEVFKDRSIGLPPMNMALARRLMEGTKIFELLKGYRNMPGINLEELQFIIYKFSYLVMDFPEIKEIDINPFVIDHEGGAVLDANIVLDQAITADPKHPYQHLVISPYPSQYEKDVVLKNGHKIRLRPIRPEDEPMEAELFERLSRETIYFRFFGYINEVNHSMLSRFTHIDYDREMAIIAEVKDRNKYKIIGVVRLIAEAWNESAEYAIVIADSWQRLGLGNIMTEYIIEIARSRGIQKIEADVLESNEGMIHLLRKYEFDFRKSEASEYHFEKNL
ncbi:MAG: bifunctional acetate--CoA ligase family protein/GNAT family N-acetyltransferase [Saprospiraceae bacterium]|nr:bifunctional acetate--CoA ligase family protein/GNAT family N-acetyltransferase [Saprospiraceae bacterium]